MNILSASPGHMQLSPSSGCRPGMPVTARTPPFTSLQAHPASAAKLTHLNCAPVSTSVLGGASGVLMRAGVAREAWRISRGTLPRATATASPTMCLI